MKRVLLALLIACFLINLVPANSYAKEAETTVHYGMYSWDGFEYTGKDIYYIRSLKDGVKAICDYNIKTKKNRIVKKVRTSDIYDLTVVDNYMFFVKNDVDKWSLSDGVICKMDLKTKRVTKFTIGNRILGTDDKKSMLLCERYEKDTKTAHNFDVELEKVWLDLDGKEVSGYSTKNYKTVDRYEVNSPKRGGAVAKSMGKFDKSHNKTKVVYKTKSGKTIDIAKYSYPIQTYNFGDYSLVEYGYYGPYIYNPAGLDVKPLKKHAVIIKHNGKNKKKLY